MVPKCLTEEHENTVESVKVIALRSTQHRTWTIETLVVLHLQGNVLVSFLVPLVVYFHIDFEKCSSVAVGDVVAAVFQISFEA